MAKVATLTDNFDDNSINSTLWVTQIDAGSSIAETGGQIVLTPPSSPATGGVLINSQNSFDLTGSTCTVEVVQALTTSANTSQMFWGQNGTAQIMLAFQLTNASLDLWYVSGGTPDIISIPRNDRQQRWWRFRESSGTVYWEVSPNRATWTTLRTIATPSGANQLQVALSAATNAAVTTPGSAIFDNFNTESTIYRNTAEGQPNGTTLTAANSGGGSGDAFATVTTSGTITVTYSTEMSMFGSQSYKVVSSNSSALYIRPSTSGAYCGSSQMYLYLPTYADNNQQFISIYSSGGYYPATLNINQLGAVRINNRVGSNLHTSANGTMPTGQWVRIDLAVEVGSTTTDGRIMAQASLLNSFTPFWSYDSGYTTNTGTDTISEYRFGKLDTVPNIALFYMDNLAWRSGMLDFIPPESSSPGVAWFTA